MDDFTATHLRNWWDQHRWDDEADLYDDFVDFVTEDLDYWSDHGWAAAWRSYEYGREMSQ